MSGEETRIDPQIEGFIHDLTNPDVAVRRHAAYALGWLKATDAVDALIAVLEDKELQQAMPNAITALSEIGDRRAVEPFLGLLANAELQVRTQVAEALGTLGDAQAVPALLNLLKDEDEGVQQAAATALGEIGDERALLPLVALLKISSRKYRPVGITAFAKFCESAALPLLDAFESATITGRAEITHALGYLGDTRAFPRLIAALHDKYPKTRKAAAFVLGNIGDQQALPALIEALADPEPGVRANALDSLVQLDGESASEYAVQMLHDENRQVRRRAVKALAEIENQRVLTVFRHILENRDEDETIRYMVIERLYKANDPQVRLLLINKLIDPTENAQVREAIAGAFGESANTWAVDPLLQALKHINGDKRLSYWFPSALAEIGDKRAVEPLLALLAESETVEIDGLVRALGTLGDSRAIEPLRHLPESDSDLSILFARAKLGDTTATEPLIEILTMPDLDEGATFRDNDRRSAAAALGILGDNRAVEPLILALHDIFDEVRGRAAEALGKIGDERAIPALMKVAQTDIGDIYGIGRVRDVAAEAIQRIKEGKAGVGVIS